MGSLFYSLVPYKGKNRLKSIETTKTRAVFSTALFKRKITLLAELESPTINKRTHERDMLWLTGIHGGRGVKLFYNRDIGYVWSSPYKVKIKIRRNCLTGRDSVGNIYSRDMMIVCKDTKGSV